MANGDDSNGSPLARILGSLENKIIFLIASVFLGVSGNQILTQINPEAVRPDPWTATMAKDAHAHMRDEWRDIFNRYESRIQRDINRLEKDIESCERKIEK